MTNVLGVCLFVLFWRNQVPWRGTVSSIEREFNSFLRGSNLFSWPKLSQVNTVHMVLLYDNRFTRIRLHIIKTVYKVTYSLWQEKKEILIQEYEDQIRELRQQKLELEQKVSLLEWQLENMKQKLELQEISHRRKISTLNEKVSDLDKTSNLEIWQSI